MAILELGELGKARCAAQSMKAIVFPPGYFYCASRNRRAIRELDFN